MNINYKVLKNINACDSEIKKFIETFGCIKKDVKETPITFDGCSDVDWYMSKLDLKNVKTILVKSDDYSDVDWLINKIELRNVIIRFENSEGMWIEKHYNKNNLVRYNTNF